MDILTNVKSIGEIMRKFLRHAIAIGLTLPTIIVAFFLSFAMIANYGDVSQIVTVFFGLASMSIFYVVTLAIKRIVG